ncbi:DUF3039 domain-containing protein [Bifidobacterium sp. ESL0790]|uniref:DUF3039 domain-containing protein n=1 Tax=Bifidobacterium sp. ESL0790 TaxID=2983233 RepID=UPI0023F7559F|nr:DUF3039 domain-containing protein [Bifidobacterium sp. ESL0790]WEV73146.1 DUF3039 domain-containing protein [Bifidobacterium sp. ESL0790]
MTQRGEAGETLGWRDQAGFENPAQSPDSGAGTAMLERPETKEEAKRDDGGDADRFAHYVSKRKKLESQMTGRPVVALCGKVWVPKHDGKKYPVCPDCKRIHEEMMNEPSF